VVRSGEGRVLLEGALGVTLLAGRDDTGGTAAFVLHPLAPRALGSPVHTHHREDEWTYVLDGQVGVLLGDRTWVAGPGDLVLKPRGVPHAFWNPGDTPARMLEVITPGGFEGYFARLAGMLAGGAPPDLQALGALAAEFGMEIDADSVPRLAREHGLDLTAGPR
jgi:quercetin dioxygenase-like cupin family protein